MLRYSVEITRDYGGIGNIKTTTETILADTEQGAKRQITALMQKPCSYIVEAVLLDNDKPLARRRQDMKTLQLHRWEKIEATVEAEKEEKTVTTFEVIWQAAGGEEKPVKEVLALIDRQIEHNIRESNRYRGQREYRMATELDHQTQALWQTWYGLQGLPMYGGQIEESETWREAYEKGQAA